jgi:MFS family permease
MWRKSFRRLWVGMSLSYAGDRLQELAQAWLVATLTQSALAVATIAIIAALPQFLTPLGGVIADQVDRRRLIITGQLVGAMLTLFIGVLVYLEWISIWHVYFWAFVAGTIWLFSRPAYKVVLTQIVPTEEVRAAASINSISETSAQVVMGVGGSILLQVVGLPIAFVFNSLSYLAGAGSLWQLNHADMGGEVIKGRVTAVGIITDLREGFRYLITQPKLFQPLLLTTLTVLITVPASGLLPALVRQQGGSIISLGLLAATGSVGALLGAIYAGAHDEGDDPVRRYCYYGLAAAVAFALFALLPIGYGTAVPFAVIGFILFTQAVWNTSRIRLLADKSYQARLQAITTMTFTVGGAIGNLWGGLVVDWLGASALVGGAVALAGISIVVLLVRDAPVA